MFTWPLQQQEICWVNVHPATPATGNLLGECLPSHSSNRNLLGECCLPGHSSNRKYVGWMFTRPLQQQEVCWVNAYPATSATGNLFNKCLPGHSSNRNLLGECLSSHPNPATGNLLGELFTHPPQPSNRNLLGECLSSHPCPATECLSTHPATPPTGNLFAHTTTAIPAHQQEICVIHTQLPASSSQQERICWVNAHLTITTPQPKQPQKLGIWLGQCPYTFSDPAEARDFFLFFFGGGGGDPCPHRFLLAQCLWKDTFHLLFIGNNNTQWLNNMHMYSKATNARQSLGFHCQRLDMRSRCIAHVRVLAS